MAKPGTRPPEVEYETLARWRNGWTLICLPDGRHYLKRAFRGQYRVIAVKSGFAQWTITDPKTGERVDPYRLR